MYLPDYLIMIVKLVLVAVGDIRPCGSPLESTKIPKHRGGFQLMLSEEHWRNSPASVPPGCRRDGNGIYLLWEEMLRKQTKQNRKKTQWGYFKIIIADLNPG